MPEISHPAEQQKIQAARHVAALLSIPQNQVQAALALLDDGNTIPFIARYRKEATGGLDEVQLREIAAATEKYRALEERKAEVLRLIDAQGKLTAELTAAIRQATTLQALDDLYRPYRPKRRTRASIAREQGLEPLAFALLHPGATWAQILPKAQAAAAASDQLEKADAAIAGAADIIAEQIADDPATREKIRTLTFNQGILVSSAADSGEEKVARTVFELYYDYSSSLRELKPHAVLALNRGERTGVLKVTIKAPVETILATLQNTWIKTRDRQVGELLAVTIADAYHRLLAPSIERELRRRLTESSEAQAIKVFARNLESLLLQAPVRNKVVMGVDPGYRTGCKLAVVDETGRVLAKAAIYPHQPHNRRREAADLLSRLIVAHQVGLIAIGNGTASRETESLIAEVIAAFPDVHYLIVSEAGASVYSASDLAREELPGLDVAERGAVSIARRVQDPLAELVKIEPKAIGVGQYQHDVDQKELSSSLTAVVESCVNRVGVQLNTASPALLQYIAGVSATVARRIVAWREENGPFRCRTDLLKVKGLGPKAFEQAAGFLRIAGGDMPLDNTAVHPESYPIALALLQKAGLSLDSLSRGPEALEALRLLDAAHLAQELNAGLPTVTDIVAALLRPGLDPREELPPPPFRRDVLHMEDLKPGMHLTGTVQNVVDFGAFVDIGLKKAGLIHISQLGKGYVRHPLDVLTVGQAVEVQVLTVDPELGRIGLALVRQL